MLQPICKVFVRRRNKVRRRKGRGSFPANLVNFNSYRAGRATLNRPARYQALSPGEFGIGFHPDFRLVEAIDFVFFRRTHPDCVFEREPDDG